MLVEVSILMPTSQSEAAGEAGLGGGKAGTLEEAAAAQVQGEVWLSTSQFLA